MKIVGDLISSLGRVKIHDASCEEVHRRCQMLLAALEESSFYTDPDEAMDATRILSGTFLTLIKRLNEWGNLTLMESFLRREEIQLALRAMVNDLRITAERLQLTVGHQFQLSEAEKTHLDIQDSLQVKGILRYIAGRSAEIRTLTDFESTFTPSDCQSFAMALQNELRENDGSSEEAERFKIGEALWKVIQWTKMSPPIARLDVEVRLNNRQLVWKSDFTEIFAGLWGEHAVALTVTKALDNSAKTRLAIDGKVDSWRHLHHNNIKTFWGYIYAENQRYTVGPVMKHWDISEYLRMDPPVDRIGLILSLAAGLEFLHKQSPPILVGLVTPLGIQVSENSKPCIADYGILPLILQLAGEGALLDTPFNGRYLAPELLTQCGVRITPESDVYGFAMLCLDLLSGLPPYHDLPEEQFITLVRNGVPPSRPENELAARWIYEDIWELLLGCWSVEPSSRPNMSSVLDTLRMIQRGRKEASASVTLRPQRRNSELASKSLMLTTVDVPEMHVQYTSSGEIVSGSLSGLVSKLLTNASALSADPVSNTFFYTFHAFSTPEILLDTLERVFKEKFSQAKSIEARIAICFDLLGFLEAWLRRDRSYIPSTKLTDRMRKLVPVESFNAPPTLIDKVRTLGDMIDEWFGMWASRPLTSPTTAPAPPKRKFSLGGRSPRVLACSLAYIQSELYFKILPPDFVQWYRNLNSRSGVNGVTAFINRCMQIGHWVLKAVLEATDLRRRAEIVEFFIHTATECQELGDYSSMSAIVLSIRSSLITSLTLTWKCIGRKVRDKLLAMNAIFDPARNASNYRKSFELTNGPRIPFLGVHLLDIKMLFAIAAPEPFIGDDNVPVPFAKYQNLYRHIIKIIMDPEDHAYYGENCQSDLCGPLLENLKNVVVDDSSRKDLSNRSAELITSERRRPGRKYDQNIFMPDIYTSAEDARSQNSEDQEYESEHSLKQLPLPVQDLSGDIVQLQDHSIAGGGFCDVYLGEGTISGTTQRVAMKKLRVVSKERKITKAFYREVELWVRVRHPYVLPFYGVSDQGGGLFMISPWASHGNALQYLQTHPNANRRKILWQTSDALSYLHSGAEIPPIVHGDIKAENIIISDSGDAMLADFGLARLVDTIAAMTATTTSFAGTARFMAPELVLPQVEGAKEASRTSMSDVYAFGCLILQIFTGERPFSHLPLEAMVILAISRGEKPSPQPPGHEAFSRGFDRDLWALAHQCWAFDPMERPKMKIVSAQLRDAMYRINLDLRLQ